ncbi:MAG: VanW family protein [Firmicutes bacterium]|nr:VanW family protein [Bacillota bacterium]
MYKIWLAGLWLIAMSIGNLWGPGESRHPWTVAQFSQQEFRPDAPVIIENVPGKSQAEALKLPYLLASRTTNYYHATPSQAKNIELVASRLNGAVVQPGHIFSYYQRVGPYTAENGFGWGRMFVGDRIVPSIGGGVCQGSSTLYSALLRTGLPILERHHHGLTVPYLPPGEDATVASDYLDFRFKNNRSTPILITAEAHDRHLTVAIWGATPGPEIVVKHQILAVYPYRTITQRNPRLKAGEQKIVAPGQEGVKVKTWLEIKSPSGVTVKDLGIDQYRPSPRIIEVGPDAS